MSAEADQRWMQAAITLAEQAEAAGEVPVGAVVVCGGVVVGQGHNRTILDNDPTAHAEVVALRAAGRAVGNYRLPGCTLYVTLEPCMMCAGAMVHARLDAVVFGAADPKTGVAGGRLELLNLEEHNHRVTVRGGVLADACGDRLRRFFRSRR